MLVKKKNKKKVLILAIALLTIIGFLMYIKANRSFSEKVYSDIKIGDVKSSSECKQGTDSGDGSYQKISIIKKYDYNKKRCFYLYVNEDESKFSIGDYYSSNSVSKILGCDLKKEQGYIKCSYQDGEVAYEASDNIMNEYDVRNSFLRLIRD